MADVITKVEDMIVPEVMGKMISAKLEKKILVSKIAKVDNTLQGRAGDTVTVPQYKYIGDANDVGEGVDCETSKLETSSVQFTIKKIKKGVAITDESILCGYGDPLGESERQLALAMANKIDNDCVDVLMTEDDGENGGVTLVYKPTTKAQIKYAGVVDAIDLFEEEVTSEKVMYIHPKQMTQLRKDADFISADKYDNNVVLEGEIGKIAGTRIVRSKKVKTVTVGGDTCYACPIVKLNNDSETEADAPALTVYLKRDIKVEKDRIAKKDITDIYASKYYGVALTNTSKVVLAYFKV